LSVSGIIVGKKILKIFLNIVGLELNFRIIESFVLLRYILIQKSLLMFFDGPFAKSYLTLR